MRSVLLPEPAPRHEVPAGLTLDDALPLLGALQELSRLQDLGAVMEVVRRTARALTRADGVTFVLREGDRVFYADEDAIGPLWKGQRFPATSCISGWAMIHRQSVVIEDIYADPRIPIDAYSPTFVKSLAMVPIRREDPLGSLGAYWSRPYRATARELEVLELLASAACTALANVELYRELAAAAAIAEKARAETEAANRAKDEFLAMLGHELRNPLSPILTMLQLLRVRGDTTLLQERAVIERQARHMVRLVDDLLDVSRIARGQLALRKRPVELSASIARAVEMAGPLFAVQGHDLDVAVPATGLPVEADEERLVQILVNLLSNAAKFTPAGGKVVVRASADDGSAAVSIQDSGVGIEPGLLPTLFTPFTQSKQNLARSQGGLGLGLAIVRSLVELHGGTVQARSAGKGQGSTFLIRLPLAARSFAEPPEQTALPVPARTRSHAPQSILIVDDNEDAALCLADVLAAAGHRTWAAFDGPSALDLARRERPDVALLDIGLPIMDGYELAGRLRELLGSVRIVATTGYGQPSDRERSRRAGFDAHLVKPVALETVERTLAELREQN